MKKIIYKAIFICLISAILGIVYNSLSSRGIPLFLGSPKASEQFPVISLEEARMKFTTQEAIFVDARSKEDYLQEHIEGAINLPYNDFEREYSRLFPILNPLQREIIVYCTGKDCDSSLIVAENLDLIGYTNIKLFADGWLAWFAADYPRVEGEE